MANALKITDHEAGSVTLDVEEALQAAIVRSMEAGSPERTAIDFVSKEQWRVMDESQDNILVFDPE